MSYTVQFYAMDGHVFARQMREEADVLMTKFRARSGFTDEAYMRILQEICRGEFPENCGPDYYIGLAWLADVASERMTICKFQDFNQLEYLDEIGIWPWLRRCPPPFPVPSSEKQSPGVGYLPVGEIEGFAFPEFERLFAAGSREVENARDEFRDVLQTLVGDRLDLLAILIYSHA